MTTSQANTSALRPDGGRDPIVAVGQDRRREAITRLLTTDGTSDPEHARRFLEYAHEHAVTLSHLWAWTDERQRMLAVALAVPGAGHSAMVFASQAATAIEKHRTGEVLHFGMRQLQNTGVHLAQSLLDPHESDAIETFEAGGFERLATLSYLERGLHPRRLPPPAHFPDDVTLQPYRESLRRDMIATLDATYEDTLDCPGLRGRRSTADILDGHRASGHFDPSFWTVLRLNDQPAGVLLLNPANDKSSIELVYLGLAKAARGRGLGAQLLRYGLHQVAKRQERIMTLAVDEANTPALNLYKREGFRTVLRRVAMIRSLREFGDASLD